MITIFSSIAVGNEHPVATLPVLSATSRVELCIHERSMSPQMKRKSEENLDIPSKQMKSSVSLASQEKEKAKKTQTKLFAGQDRTLKVLLQFTVSILCNTLLHRSVCLLVTKSICLSGLTVCLPPFSLFSISLFTVCSFVCLLAGLSVCVTQYLLVCCLPVCLSV